jgi:hypothetical protein
MIRSVGSSVSRIDSIGDGFGDVEGCIRAQKQGVGSPNWQDDKLLLGETCILFRLDAKGGMPGDMPTEAPYGIPINPLLRDSKKTLDRALVLNFKRLADLPLIRIFNRALFYFFGRGSFLLRNLSRVSAQALEDIYQHFGEAGLSKLMFLSTAYPPSDFDHFFKVIEQDLAIRLAWSEVQARALARDNGQLRECIELKEFASNVIRPVLSRKLYNPGGRDGLVVYGLGGPRILVSHPFRGANRDVYDIYMNSVDIVGSLMTRGFLGTFLFLDYLPSLNVRVDGVPAWLLWFSIISAHSDLVLYVREDGDEFSVAQKREIEFTPDQVTKKVVVLRPGELTLARIYGAAAEFTMYFVPGKGRVSEAEWNALEAELALPFVKAYKRGVFPSDRIIRIDELNRIAEFPFPQE